MVVFCRLIKDISLIVVNQLWRKVNIWGHLAVPATTQGRDYCMLQIFLILFFIFNICQSGHPSHRGKMKIFNRRGRNIIGSQYRHTNTELQEVTMVIPTWFLSFFSLTVDITTRGLTCTHLLQSRYIFIP